MGLALAAPAGAAPVAAKALVLTAQPTSSVWSQPVRLSMSITPRGGGAPRGGTVTFHAEETVLGTAPATTRITTLTTTALAPGTHTVTASYAGDPSTSPGTSNPITVTVAPAATTTTVAPKVDPVATGDLVELRAVVRPVAPALPGRRPSGTVRFTTGTAAGNVRLDANGVAVWRRALPDGTHTVTATYSGATGFTPGDPATTTVTVGDRPAASTIAGGLGHSCAVGAGGTVSCWGDNNQGQLGDDNGGNSSAVPVAVTGLTGVTAIAAGNNHTCALLGDGTAECWGHNALGQLGNDSDVASDVPVVVSGLAGATAITAGEAHSCALLDDGTARCWGSSSAGQLGDGNTGASDVPVTVSGLTDATAIEAGREHTCAVLDDGTARCWGFNNTGELGDGTTDFSSVPVPVSGLTGAVGITGGEYHSCAVLDDGTARCWGYNLQGQLGNDSDVNSLVPVTVSGLADAVAISSGGYHVCAVLGDGTARCWGTSDDGQLGDGGGAGSDVPVTVFELTAVASLGSGTFHSCALLDDGTGRCWGDNQTGQLGDGGGGDSNVPVAVGGP